MFVYTKHPRPSGDQHLPFQWSGEHTSKPSWRIAGNGAPRSRRQCFDVFPRPYFSALLTLRASDKPKKIITAFAPRMNDAFFDDYPDGLLISICRHPARLVRFHHATSARTQMWIRDGAVARIGGSAMLLKERHPDQVLSSPFEALVADTSGVMKRLAERLASRLASSIGHSPFQWNANRFQFFFRIGRSYRRFRSWATRQPGAGVARANRGAET